MKYTKFQYLPPLRAETAVPPNQLITFEGKPEWIAQFKKNGTNNMIFVAPDKSLITRNRYGKQHANWKPSRKSGQVFTETKATGWCVFNTELMDAKTPHIKDTNYIHDILVYDGVYLFGWNYEQRYHLLMKLFGERIEDETVSHYVLNDNTWLAKNYRKDFQKLFITLKDTEDEGLVLKDVTVPFTTRTSTWTYKCRKPHKNFSF